MFLVCAFGASASEWNTGIAPYFMVYLKNTSDLYKYGIEDPCGKHLELQGFELPIDNDNFEISWIYELSKSGRALNKWPIPVDTLPAGLSGDNLTLSTSHESQPFVVVNHNGEITRYTGMNNALITTIKCPDQGGHDGCMKIFDETMNKYRIVTMISTCT